MWITAFVDPPRANTAAMALLKEASRNISRGFKSSHTISTMRRPERLAILAWLESTAGIALAPRRDKPSTSATLVRGEAAPMLVQVPAEAEMPPSLLFQAGSRSARRRR